VGFFKLECRASRLFSGDHSVPFPQTLKLEVGA
jgi:hypothetical protein